MKKFMIIHDSRQGIGVKEKRKSNMAETNWTEEQRQVIYLRDRNILVSAAAGSGKTAVLVERIIQEVTDPEHPIDIDRLLVVTFTKAAAGEMRSRVGNALERLLLKHPEDEHLQRQLSLIHNAQITTIDSFCQNIIRNYFHVIGLDPVFRVADETETTLMMSDILQELLEKRYEEGRKRFLDFTEMFSPGRTDSAVEDLILHMYRIAMSYPWPLEWLAKVTGVYQCHSLEELEQSEWMKELVGYLGAMIENYLQMAKQARQICMEGDGPDTYLPAIESDIQQLESLAQAHSYQEYAEAFATLNPARLSGKKTDAVPEKKEQVKTLRESYLKKGIQQLQDHFFFDSPENMLSDLQQMEPMVQELTELTGDFIEAFGERKREEGLLDFSDMEHFALEILTDRSQGETRPSQTARELQEYYQEILIDEYQDSNFIQELILGSISRAPEHRPYLFMVGDVKQSIYQFRLARPELFNEKYHSYTVDRGPYQRIDLHRNFRSRESVLESANYLFRQLMQECLGGIRYDQAAALVPGAVFEEYDKRTAAGTQVMLIERQGEDEETFHKVAMEAAAIGGKIRQLVQGEDPLYVKGKDLEGKEKYHRLEYRDIVILLRSPGNQTEDYIEILTDMGIPAYSETKTGYFSTMEVETVLNLLRIIDNPRQDIPMAAVLRSCLVGLSDEELAWIGAMPREMNYQDGIIAFLKEYPGGFPGKGEQGGKVPEKNTGQTEEGRRQLYEKLSAFWETLKKYQEMAQIMSVYELLRRIYQESGYYYRMSAMPAGEKRAANLDILLQQAVEFARRGHGGVFPFIRYIESLRKTDIDFGEASIVNENTNAVRIMSIHKSKGLEFPVVFVAGLGKQFNLQDARRGTIIDPDHGVGADHMDLERRLKNPTLIKKFMANRIKQNTLAEEIRILYVALTRAKEMLILTGTVANLEKKLERWDMKRQISGLSDLTSVTTYLDWIMPVVRSDGGGAHFTLEFLTQQDLIQNEVEELADDMGRYALLKEWDTDRCYDQGMREALEKQTQYEYPYQQDAGIPVKISVSELKRRQMEWEEESWLESEWRDTVSVEIPSEEIPRPVFLAGEKEISGAGKGTLYHLLMEHLPYERISNECMPSGGMSNEGIPHGDSLYSGKPLQDREESRLHEWGGLEIWMEEMCEKGYLSQQEKELINPGKLQQFLRSPIGGRMGQAALQGNLYREQPFMLGLPAREIYRESDSQELVLVQGIIDAWFLEGDEIVLVDYKTDTVRKGHLEELGKKYRVQLGYYAQALERLTGKKVKEQIIYSFSLGEELCM